MQEEDKEACKAPEGNSEKKAVVDWLLNSNPVSEISENEIDLNSLEGEDFVDKLYKYYRNKNQLQVKRGNGIVNITKNQEKNKPQSRRSRKSRKKS
jgi:hypothetical protein